MSEKKYIVSDEKLMSEWDWEKNHKFGLNPKLLTFGSGQKAWWKCDKGHKWEATIANRNNGKNCPFCSGQRVIKGENDLKTINPDLAKEWNYKKNDSLHPDDVFVQSGKKVWWICKNGHEWQARIQHRSNGVGCPYCSGRFAISGKNDLQTIYPDLAKEWNLELNKGISPSEVLPNSNKKVWWICKKGHEWQATIANRTLGNKCPVCQSERHTSFPEYALVYYLRKYGIDVIHSHKDQGYELDIFIPSKKIAIEYDGYYWHKNKTKEDLEKNLKCKNDGIKLYRLREGLQSLNDYSIDYFVEKNQLNLSNIITKILYEITENNADVNLKRDYIEIENTRIYTEKENSIISTNPHLINEWNYSRNGKLNPEGFSSNSHKNVWWVCKKGHEWQASIANRNKGRGCPYCSNRQVLPGYNDLLTTNPSLAQEWDYSLNKDLQPTSVGCNSHKKVWWTCHNGHSWQAKIVNRNFGAGCPYCTGRCAVRGKNDLQTINPNLAKEWNFKLNKGLKPTEVLPNSNKKVWWICEKGHEWQAVIASRNNNVGCPICYKINRHKKDS